MTDQPETRRPGSRPTAVRAPPSLPPGWPRRGWRDRLYGALSTPELLALLFSAQRRLAPVLRIGRRVIVSRHRDVVDVLSRDEDFTIAEVNAERMERWSGAFLLGFDRGSVYDREVGALRRAVCQDDLGRIGGLVVDAASQLVEEARPAGRIDVVNGFARVVATAVVGTYFGVPGPDAASTMRWMRALFDAVFVDDSARARRAATLMVAEQRPYMEALIASRRAAVAAQDGPGGRSIGTETVPDDVLTRLVSMEATEPWLDDDAVRRNINGLIVGALDTTSKSVALVMDELLRRPDALEGARQAALAGDLDVVRDYAWEALRFRPHAPLLERRCARDTTLGRRNTRVRAGSTVLVSTMSAMLDDAAFPEPRRVRPGRPADRYLHFGHGIHTCFGRHINEVQIPALVAALVRLPGLRRAPGREGRLLYDGPFPDRLVVEFDAGEDG